MIFRVSDALPEIAPFVEGGGVDPRCEPGRSKAFSSMNRAIRQLMNEGDWKGMTVPVCLPVRGGGLVILDERFDAIRLAKWKTGSPIPIYSEGFKFLEGGLDPAESGIPSLVDIGESTPLHRPLPRPMAIMAYSEQVEQDGIHLEIRGTDESGREALIPLPIRHSWRSASPPAYTGQDCDRWLSGRWSAVTELRKPVTKGLVHVFGYDPSSQESVWLATLRPESVCPVHRLYLAPRSACGNVGQIVAQASLRWHPMHFETDVLPVQNIDAVARMVQALHALDTRDPGGYEFYKNSAISQLNKQLAKHHRPTKKGLNVSVRRSGSAIRSGRSRGYMVGEAAVPHACREASCETRTIPLADLNLTSSPFTEEWYAEVESRLRELEETTVLTGSTNW